MTSVIWKGLAAAVLVAATAAACGGGSTPTTPSPSPTPTPTPTTGTPTDSATFTIGADGRITPASVTVVRGGRVTMINNHNVFHEMNSDPHPEHSDCTELNQWGFLQPGQQRTSSNLNTARTCRFHDHNRPEDNGLKGTITIQ